eukprot:7221959-Heterocapsa_arctica.AAC.2
MTSPLSELPRHRGMKSPQCEQTLDGQAAGVAPVSQKGSAGREGDVRGRLNTVRGAAAWRSAVPSLCVRRVRSG